MNCQPPCTHCDAVSIDRFEDHLINEGWPRTDVIAALDSMIESGTEHAGRMTPAEQSVVIEQLTLWRDQ